MELEFILGGASTGKTSYCIQDMISKLNENKNNSFIYIVPEQFSLQSEKDLIDKSANKCMMQVRVLSFNRLAYHVFSETGFVKNKTLDDAGKNMLIRKILLNMQNELEYYKKAISKNGFIQHLSEIITDFYKYNISVEQLEESIHKGLKNDSLKLKLGDLLKIYRAYSKYTEEGYISSDAALDILTQKIDCSSFLKSSYIWIDGFFGFTNQEFNVIRKLLTTVKKISISLTIKEKIVYPFYLNKMDPFYDTKDTMLKIIEIAKDTNTTILPTIYLQNDNRAKLSPELDFLEKIYFSQKSVYNDENKQIFISPAANIYEEISVLANDILYLVRDCKYQYNQIAIVTNSISTYEKIIKGVFDKYDIPVFIDTKTDVFSHPIIEMIRSIIDIVSSNWSYEAVFRFLKTGILNISTDELFNLENYCLANGIKGYKWHLSEWKSGFYNSLFDKEKIHATKSIVVNSISPFSNNLKHNSSLTVREFSERVFNFLYALNVTDYITEIIDDSMQAGDNRALRINKQIWNKICHVFDKMVEILSDETITIKEFSKILDAGILGLDMGIIPPSQEQVIVGDVERSRFPNIRALFVIGTNEGILPSIFKENGLLSDTDKQILNEMGIEISKDRKRKILQENLAIYSIINKPKEYLKFSYSLGNLNGKSLNPSSIITKLQRMFSKLTPMIPNDSFISTAKPMFDYTGFILQKIKQNINLSDSEKIIYSWFMEHSFYKNNLETMKELLFYRNYYEKLNKETVNKLYGQEIITSASRLEQFVKCPFAYFAKYALLAYEREIYKVDSLDLGNLFHEILEEFSAIIDTRNIGWSNLTEDIIDEIVNEVLDKIKLKLEKEVFLSSSAYQYLVHRVARISKKSIWALSKHIGMGDFKPFGSELSFKADVLITQIEISIGSTHKFILTGRIDRVDILDFNNNLYVKVIDYKSGNMQFDLTNIYYGSSLQLILYLDMLIKNKEKFFPGLKSTTEIKPGGIFYFNIDDPIIYSGDTIFENNNELNRLNELILTQFKMSGLAVADKEIIKSMDRDIKSYSNVIKKIQLSSDSEYGFTRNSSVASYDQFDALMDFAREKMKQIGSRILSGDIEPKPFKYGQSTACDYCEYKGICQFEAIDLPNKYVNYKKIDNISEIIT